MTDWEDLMGMSLTRQQCARFDRYYRLLEETNKVMNLTAVTGEADAARLHFADSLTCSPFIPKGSDLLDVGSGAGFPGIPLAIYREDLHITLLDSLGKRVHFLQTVISELGLTHAKAVHLRAEDAALLGKSYDVVTARAVARLNVLCEYLLPFVKKGGLCLCLKGPQAEAETKEATHALKVLGGTVESVSPTPLEGLEHRIVLIRKTDITPKGYPRKAGTPAKNPL